MQKFFFLMLFFFIINSKTIAQDTPVNNAPAFDSAAVLNDLLLLLDSADISTSYALVSLGINNRLFSLHNNTLNAKQASTSTLVYNPSVGYFHKSGFSLSAGASLLNRQGKGFGATQYSLTPAYDLLNNQQWAFGVSYSRYFISDKYSSYSSPLQNDLYLYTSYTKHWLQPGIALGYSTGNYTEINKFTVQLTGNTYTDTGTYHLKAFSFMASVGHDFKWQRLFGKEDELGFTPSLLMNFGSDSTESVSHTLGQNLVRFLKRRRRIPRLGDKNSFEAQSVGASLDFNYAVGNFTILPQVYFDYYLPKTDEKRFTQTFTLSVGYSF
ncbi:MAG: hypothetical protein V4685_15410 [Bacteroidota bacterium]